MPLAQRTLHRAKLTERLEVLPVETMARVGDGPRAALDLA